MQQITQNVLKDTMYSKNIPVFSYEIHYPSFETLCNPTAASTINNNYILLARKTEVHARTNLYQQAADNAQYIPSVPPPFESYIFQSMYTVPFNQRCITSLYFDEYSFLGGAHGSTERHSDTWDFCTGRQLKLHDFFHGCTDFAEILFSNIEKQIAERLKESPSSYFDDYKMLVRKNFHFENYFVTPNGIVIYYQQYDVAPYATGITEFLIPF